jgi:hypothetical protein
MSPESSGFLNPWNALEREYQAVLHAGYVVAGRVASGLKSLRNRRLPF